MSVNLSNIFPKKDNFKPVNEAQEVAKLQEQSIFSVNNVINPGRGMFFDNSGMPISTFDFSEFDHIPNGHSHYEYNGAYFDIYRRGDDYQSQFVHPEFIDREDFYREFPNLKPIAPEYSDDSEEGKTSVVSVNGKIDEDTIQGSTGDCWVISPLYSMANTEQGQKILSDSITVNDDNTVTVSFKGIGVSYTMTPEEIAQFDTDNNTSDEYSNGDNDVLVMELAVQKLWKDINSGRVTINTSNSDLAFTGKEGISSGGLPAQLIYYLTGVEPTQLYNSDLSDLSQNQIYGELQKAYESGNYSLTFGLYGNGHKAKLTNGETFELDLGEGGHALAITDVGEDTVTFVNPWDTSKKYTMSWAEFSKLGVGYLSSADLTKTKQVENTIDKTDASNYLYKNGDSSSFSNHISYKRGSKRDGGFNIFDEIINNLESLIKELFESDKTSNKLAKKDKKKVSDK